MVLSAYLAIAIPRVIAMTGDTPTLDQEKALNIKFPNELLLAMGISATSFAGASLIKSNKKNKTIQIDLRSTPETAQERRDRAKKDLDEAVSMLEEKAQIENDRKKEYDAATAEVEAAQDEDAKKIASEKQSRAKTLYDSAIQDKLNAAEASKAKDKNLKAAEADLVAIQEAEGLLHRNPDPKDAKCIDLFRGEEIKNYKLVDMSKVQMLFFTIVVVAAYSAAIAGTLSNSAALQTAASFDFPDFEPSLNALLGISHGTYLSVKTVDQP
jgi:endonuclease YncB( thermonuclease family)